MALNLPNNPTIGQTITEGSRAWQWNGRYWQATSLNVGYTGSQGDTGYTGSKGDPGNFGGVTLDYTYSDNNDSTVYPGVGRLKFNTRDMTQAESLIIADSDDNNINLDNYLATIDASTSEIRGHFRVTKKLYPEFFVMFAITGPIDTFDDYYVVPCNFVSGNLTDSSTAFELDDDILITFARTGDKGEAGYTGSQGVQGPEGPVGSSIDIVGSVETPEDLPMDGTSDGSTLLSVGDGLIVNSTGELYVWDGNQWNNAGRIVGPQGFTGSQGDQGELGYTGSEGVGYTGSEGESSFSWGPTPPEYPEVGARWYDTTESLLLVYVDDGDSQQWVEVAASGFMGQTGYTGSGAYPSLANNSGAVLINDGDNVSWSEGTMMFRNRIINGDMRVDQRNAGNQVTVHASYPVDRWAVAFINGAATGFSAQRSADVPTNTSITRSLRYSVTTGGSSGATGNYGIQQRIEGYNIEDLGFGTAAAEDFTISFWAKSSLVGTYGISLRNSAKDRSYIASYSISAADTWEYKRITISADTQGTWLTTNGIGLDIFFDLGSGTDFQTGGDTWTAGNFLGLNTGVKLAENSDASFYLTAVQLERGTVATKFERRLFSVELALCQRYFCKSYPLEAAVGTTYAQNNLGNGQIWARENTTQNFLASSQWNFPVTMRGNPSVTIYNPVTAATASARLWNTATNVPAYSTIGSPHCVICAVNNTSVSASALVVFHMAANAEI